MNADEVLDGIISDYSWPWMLTEIKLGRQAAGVVYDDLHTLRPRPVYDDAVEASVTFMPDLDEERTVTAVLPLSDVWRLETGGAFVVDVQPASRSIGLMALARADPGLIAVVDYRGAGSLALSTVHPEDVGLRVTQGTVGAHVRGWEQRSGVKAVNDRRSEAAAEIFSQYPKAPTRFKRDIVRDIIVAEIWEYYIGLPCGPGYAWQVYQDGAEIIEFDATPARIKRTADRIVDALSVEAYGTNRPDDAGSRWWHKHWEDEPEDTFNKQTGERLPGMSTYPTGENQYKRWVNHLEIRPIHLIGNFNLRHLRHDYVGDLAAELADGTGGLSEFWALYSSRYEELVDYWGLAPHEAEMLVLNVRGGLDAGEIGELFGIDPRIVWQMLKRARQKSTLPPLAPAIHPSIARAIEAAKRTPTVTLLQLPNNDLSGSPL